MIPYRFSFLFSFVLLYMAYRAYLLRRHFKVWQIIVAGILALGVFACSDSRTDPVFIAYNLVFLLLYLAVLLYPALLKALPRDASAAERLAHKETKLQRRKLATLSLAGILCAELVLNVVNFALAFPYTSVTNYPSGTTDAQAAVAFMQAQEADTLFYRAETTHSQTLNDGALNGYNGITTFTSSANVKVTQFMQALGYGAKNTYNRYCFEESSPVANLFLGIKYMLDREGSERDLVYFDTVYASGRVQLLENNAYLPLGFLANVQLANVDFKDTGDAFGFQNKLLTAASGISEKALVKLGKECLQITSEDVEILSQTGGGYCTYDASDSKGTVTYQFTPNHAGLLCISLNLPKRNSFTVKLDGKVLYSETYSLPQTLSVANVTPGSVVQIDVTCKAGEKSNLTIGAVIVDEEVFRKAYDVLAASTLELTEFRTDFVEGTIDCDRDGLLYTSIPQNGNWTAMVDGKEADIVLIGNAMVGVPLTQGSHTVTFIYRNRAFNLGWKISVACAGVFLLLTVVTHLPKRKRGKFERIK
jgi:uncharacterized membrane protein YfhO